MKKLKVVKNECEKQKLCERFEKSGMTLLRFWEKDGVSKTALYKWRKKFVKLKVKESVSGFVQLRPSGKAAEVSVMMLEPVQNLFKSAKNQKIVIPAKAGIHFWYAQTLKKARAV